LTGAEAVVLLLAAGLSAALSGLVAASGPIDTVKGRSSHKIPTPTGAGLAIMAGTALGAALLAPGAPALAVIMAAAAGLGLFGAADDVLDLGASVKLLVQIATALVVATLAARATALTFAPGMVVELWTPLAIAGSALFLLVLINAVNFMDGSDGLASGASAVAALGLASACLLAGDQELAAVAFATAAAGLGFLPWNLRRRVFQGDVGAFFSATLLGGLGLLMSERGVSTPYLVVFAFLPLVVDVLLTLVVRARRGGRLFEAHKEHLYQLWLQRTGRPHLQLAWRVWALTAVTTAVGLGLEEFAPEWAFAGLMAATLLLSVGWFAARARLANGSVR
jgi:UDP-N-acetylmuramyl pentapeptide phosphotransferase/UDP-N-acetylglucosamine-1-phosphate transferase